MEGVLRIALNKFKARGKPHSAAEAYDLLMSINILPQLGSNGREVCHPVVQTKVSRLTCGRGLFVL